VDDLVRRAFGEVRRAAPGNRTERFGSVPTQPLGEHGTGVVDDLDRRIGIEVTVDAADRNWDGHVGLVTELLDEIPIDPIRTTSFLCGPEVMIRVVARDILESGSAAAQIRVSLERNMHCAVRQCGHCQLGPLFVCADGPVVTWAVAADLLAVRRW
jgi:hypothetical protein